MSFLLRGGCLGTLTDIALDEVDEHVGHVLAFGGGGRLELVVELTFKDDVQALPLRVRFSHAHLASSGVSILGTGAKASEKARSGTHIIITHMSIVAEMLLASKWGQDG